MDGKVLHRIENGHGREEDIELRLSFKANRRKYHLSIMMRQLGQ
jgi:hypothetical protein